MSPVHVLQMSPVHVLQMSPVQVLQMSPVQVLQMIQSMFYKMSPVQVLQVQSRFYKSSPVQLLQQPIKTLLLLRHTTDNMKIRAGSDEPRKLISPWLEKLKLRRYVDDVLGKLQSFQKNVEFHFKRYNVNEPPNNNGAPRKNVTREGNNIIVSHTDILAPDVFRPPLYPETNIAAALPQFIKQTFSRVTQQDAEEISEDAMTKWREIQIYVVLEYDETAKQIVMRGGGRTERIKALPIRL